MSRLLLVAICALLCMVVGPVRIQAQTPVAAPTIESVTPGDGRLTIEWTAPAGVTGIAAYDLRYIETSADETVDANWTEVEDISNLSHGGAPAIDSVTGVTGGLTVGWSAPASDDDATVTSYDLRYIKTSADEAVDANWTIETGAWTSGDLTATVTPLEVGTQYDVQIDASGQGPWSPTRMATTAHPASLWPIEPRAGTVLRATVDDLGGRVDSLRWQWARSADMSVWTGILGRGDSYIPQGSDVGMYIRARASWVDGEGAGQTAEVVSAHAVDTREDSPDITVVELVSGLSIPWDIAFTPDGTMLFTQLSGVLSSRLVDGAVQTVSADFSDLSARGTRGLMGIVVDPDFASNRRFYTCQGHTGPEVQVIAWTISADYTAATRVGDPLVGDLPAVAYHAGCRLRFGPDGYLWIATGDAFAVGAAQDLDSLGGKVLRVDASTGAAAPGNPFGSPVYTYGHRNPQGLALRPDTRQMWLVDHGPTWDDEINLLTAGGNYGWDPVLADMPNVYTEQVPMTDLMKFPDAVEARWSSGEPTLATSGGIFLAGDDWEEWDGRLAVGTLKASELHVFEFTASGTFVSQVVVPELDGTYRRLRTPMLGPEGALYVTTSNGGGADRILKVVPSLPPSFASETDEQEVAENSSAATVVATVTATDPERQALTYALSGPDAASFTIPNSAAGQLRANAPLDREDATSYEVIVIASDPYGLSDSITLTINVTDIDEPAEITLTASPGVSADNNELSVDENHDGTLATFSASDPERKAGLTYTWSLGGTDASDFGITSAGVLSFANTPDYERPADSGGNNVYDITVNALDSDGKTGRTAVTVTVRPVDEPPTVSGDRAPSIEEEGTPLVGIYRAADPENATIAWQPLAGNDGDKFNFTTSNGRLAFKAALDYEDATDSGRNNVYDVTLSVSAGGDTTTFDVPVTVTNREEPGMLALPATRPQAEADYTATLSDPDGVVSTTWTWERSTSRSGTWEAVTGTILDSTETSVYTPVTGDFGYYLRVTAAYTDALSPPDKSLVAFSTDSVLAVPGSNSPPAFMETNPTRSVAENARARALVGRPVTATDPDLGPGNTVGYEFALPVPALFTIDTSSGQIRVKTEGSLDYDDRANRTHTVTVKASDSSNAFATVQVTIEVTDVNEPPDADADAPFRFDEDSEIEIRVLDNDSDPEDERSELLLTVFNSGPNAPRNGTVRVNEPTNAGENRTITYEPKPNYNGSDTFTYRVGDTGSPSLSSTASVSVLIDPLNDPPTFPSTTAARFVPVDAEAGALVGPAVTATDIDGDNLFYSLSGVDASSFDIDPDDGQITATIFDVTTKPTYMVTVEAVDRDGERATIEVTITVGGSAYIPPSGGGFGGGGFGGGGGGGGPSGPSPSEADFEWNVKHDIEELDSGHDKPSGMWSDGAVLWLAHNGDGADDAIYAYDLASGERVGDREFELDERNRAPRGVWSDRTTVWVSDSGRNRLFAHDLASGERLPERDLELAERNRAARGIWSNEETLWVLDGGKDALFAYDLATGDPTTEYALDSTNGDPRGIWSDGVTFWVSDHGEKRLFAYRLEAGESGEDELNRNRDEEFPNTVLSRASNNSPRGIWSDGDVMYVVDASDGRVYTYNMPDALDARLASLSLTGLDIGAFDSGRTEYVATPREGVTETTVEAASVQRRTDVAIHPPDADGNEANGHQVSLQGVSEITVTVTSADGSRERVYRVTVQRREVEVALAPTWTSIEWPGADGVIIVGALQDGDIGDKVVVVYHWDEATAAWRAFFPGLEGVPGLNTLTNLEQGRTYWIAVAEPVTWTVATP